MELDEFGSAGLQVQSAPGFIDATVVTGTRHDGHEAEGIDGLVGFGAALVARVGGDAHHRFDFSAAGYYAPDGHQFADVFSLYFTNWYCFTCGHVFEVDFTEINGIFDIKLSLETGKILKNM